MQVRIKVGTAAFIPITASVTIIAVAVAIPKVSIIISVVAAMVTLTPRNT